MKRNTLSAWLAWIINQQPAEIALGLDRVKIIAERLKLKINCLVITVGGTNGKGSTVAGLKAIYRAANFHVGAFTSPVLFKHNEYVAINDNYATDEQFCQAYEAIQNVMGEVALTPFEFHTLAALWIFAQATLDVIILEVGLGGRLDAVNIIDADIAIITSIDIDHADWLGDTREKIAYEKAGICRSGKPFICGDRNPPKTLVDQAAKIGASLFCIGKEFDYIEEEREWSFIISEERVQISPPFVKAPSGGMEGHENKILNLPLNTLYLQNMACVVMAITLLQEKLPVSHDAIVKGLQHINIKGRVQIIPGDTVEIYDVAHNPAAISYLAKCLSKMSCQGKTIAVFSMLADKDIIKSVEQIAEKIDEWHIGILDVKRAASKEQLLAAFKNMAAENIFFHDAIYKAYLAAKEKAKIGDRIIIFGSFHTVSSILVNKEGNEQS